MVVNLNHVQEILGEIEVDDPITPEDLRERAAMYEDYVSRGKTMHAPGSRENVSIDSLAEVARILRQRADALERGEVTSMDDAAMKGIGPVSESLGPPALRHHEGHPGGGQPPSSI
jgi:hypothetical protein